MGECTNMVSRGFTTAILTLPKGEKSDLTVTLHDTVKRVVTVNGKKYLLTWQNTDQQVKLPDGRQAYEYKLADIESTEITSVNSVQLSSHFVSDRDPGDETDVA